MPKPFYEKLTSPRGVMVYPRLGKADTKYKAGGEFSVKLKFDSAKPEVEAFVESLAALMVRAKEWAEQDLQEKIERAKTPADKGKLKKALKEMTGAALPVKAVLDEEGDETAEVQVNFKLNNRVTAKDGKVTVYTPVIKDAKKNVLDHTAVKIGGGSEGKVAGTWYPYYTPKDNQYGITNRIVAVQLLKLVEWSGAGEDDGFDDEEDGYVGEAVDPNKPKAAATEDDEPAGDDDF